MNNSNNKTPAVIVYSNPESDKLKILSDTKGKAGIYQWTHRESGKIYIGSTVDLSKRSKNYYSKSYLNRNKNMYICNAILAHGHSAFTLTILEIIDISNLPKNEARLLIVSREQYHFDESSEPKYNINPKAGSRLGSEQTEQAKLKISVKTKEALSDPEIQAKM